MRERSVTLYILSTEASFGSCFWSKSKMIMSKYTKKGMYDLGGLSLSTYDILTWLLNQTTNIASANYRFIKYDTFYTKKCSKRDL